MSWVRRVVVVAIAGPSGVGKSSLAAKLAEKMGSPLMPISLESYHDTTLPPGRKLNFDLLLNQLRNVVAVLAASRNMPERLEVGARRNLQNLVRESHAREPLGTRTVIVVVEGFLLFYLRSLCVAFDVHIWLEAPGRVCMRRRQQRSHKNSRKSIDAWKAYFWEHTWNNFLRSRAAQLANAGAKRLRLDATATKEELLEQAAAHCHEVLRAQDEEHEEDEQEARPQAMAEEDEKEEHEKDEQEARPQVKQEGDEEEEWWSKRFPRADTRAPQPVWGLRAMKRPDSGVAQPASSSGVSPVMAARHSPLAVCASVDCWFLCHSDTSVAGEHCCGRCRNGDKGARGQALHGKRCEQRPCLPEDGEEAKSLRSAWRRIPVTPPKAKARREKRPPDVHDAADSSDDWGSDWSGKQTKHCF